MLDFKTLLQPVSIQCHSFTKQRKECILFSHFLPFSQSHWTRALCGLKYLCGAEIFFPRLSALPCPSSADNVAAMHSVLSGPVLVSSSVNGDSL